MRFVKGNGAGKDQILLQGPASNRDFFQIDKVTYLARPLDENRPSFGHGVNATVFRAVLGDASSGEEWIIKISNFAEERIGEKAKKRRLRFEREILAYKAARDSAKGDWVLDYLGEGLVQIDNSQHRCLLLEKADRTLREHLLEVGEFTLQQRLLLCYQILCACGALHEIGIYHRDIKPENIFFVNDTPKLGDLGLVRFRHDDAEIDDPTERIGPIWWMAPEAVNRYMCIRRLDNGFIDRTVDAAADMYQLGKLFWFIIQGDVPNGVVRVTDMRVADQDVFGSILKPLLSYRPTDRPAFAEIRRRMEPLRRRYQI